MADRATLKKMQQALKSADDEKKPKEEPKKEESKVEKALNTKVVQDSPNGTQKGKPETKTVQSDQKPAPKPVPEKNKNKPVEPEKIRAKPGKKPLIEEERKQQLFYFREKTIDSLKMSALPKEMVKAKKDGTLVPDLSLMVENVVVKWLEENNYLLDI